MATRQPSKYRPTSSNGSSPATRPKTSYRLFSNRLVAPNGQFNVERQGHSWSPWHDPYHLFLTLPWVHFLSLIGFLYCAANVLFALLYLAGGNGIANADPGDFGDAFFFSVQTMASIGYGAMYPTTLYTNVIVTIEALTGLLGLAMGTGLMFARFSRPTARILFSNVAVVAPHNQVPTLMFRTANQRYNRILEAQIQLILVCNEMTLEGEFMRRFYDLSLVRSRSAIFALSWTAMHPINPDSPLYGKTSEDLEQMEAELVVTLTGLDETFSQTIHARHSYIPSELRWNQRFADIFSVTPEGRRIIDYRYFHETMALSSGL